MNHFNICPVCEHQSTCVLTAQKDKVWSCSEFDKRQPNQPISASIKQPEQELVLV